MSELTVIIPTWNGCHLLEKCLESLHRQTLPCQVIVVDNGSTDSTYEMVRSASRSFPLRLQYLALETNLGFAKAVNEGILSAHSEFVALLNNDTEADACWVENGLQAMRRFSGYSFFASRIVNYHQRHLLDSAGDCYDPRGIPFKRGFSQPIETYLEAEPVVAASAAAAFYRRALFDEIGLFDEDFFMYLEDVDWSLRAQLAGHRCLYLPEAVVYHVEAASDPDRVRGDSPKKFGIGHPNKLEKRPTATPVRQHRPYYSAARVYWITRNRWQLMITYQPLHHLPGILIGWTRSVAFHLLKAGFLGSFLGGLMAGCWNTPRAVKKRLVLRGRRVISRRQFETLLKTCNS